MDESRTWNAGRETRPRTAAIVAGVSLLAMAVIAGLSNFAVIEKLQVPGEAGITAGNLAASSGLFRSTLVTISIVLLICSLAFQSISKPCRPL